jgi:hypothetical protein
VLSLLHPHGPEVIAAIDVIERMILRIFKGASDRCRDEVTPQQLIGREDFCVGERIFAAAKS